MRVTILYFAIARERAGLSREAIELPGGATLADVQARLGRLHAPLAALLPRVRLAVNQEFADGPVALRDGDEVALIPPVAGGAEVARVVDRTIAAGEVVDAVKGEGLGCVVTFIGNVRSESRGRKVVRLEYEAYLPMAEAKLRQIGEEVERRWPGCRVAMLHRVGKLAIGDTAVVIAVAAAHRQEAFLGCSHAIERLKRDVPIWKKEVYESGEEWVGLGP